MNQKRRLLLQGTVGLGVLAGAGLLLPREVMAAWSKEAFAAKSVDDGLKALGMGAASASDQVTITAPDIAENGAVVPVTIESSLANVESISLFVPNNPSALSAHFVMGAGATGYASTRVKMGKTSDVVAVVKAGGQIVSAKKEVKVTIGGCGG
ncbi:MAG TPA: thiosulfate oxidation carrier protein SoxY [Gammaproteobacteria bacterium]